MIFRSESQSYVAAALYFVTVAPSDDFDMTASRLLSKIVSEGIYCSAQDCELLLAAAPLHILSLQHAYTHANVSSAVVGLLR